MDSQTMSHLASSIGSWGDVGIASYYGTFAAADGTMDARAVKKAMIANPEPLFQNASNETSQRESMYNYVNRPKKKFYGGCESCGTGERTQPFNLQITRAGDIILSDQSKDYSQQFQFGDIPAMNFPPFFGSEPRTTDQRTETGEPQINEDAGGVPVEALATGDNMQNVGFTPGGVMDMLQGSLKYIVLGAAALLIAYAGFKSLSS
jgi:hypothetical protein